MAGYTNMSFWSATRPVRAALAIGALLLLSRGPAGGPSLHR